jgi:hypothetical protein
MITIKYLDGERKMAKKTVYFGKIDLGKGKKKTRTDIFHPYFWEERIIG